MAALLPVATALAQSVPAAPTGLAATPLDAQAALTWDDPSDSAITGYSVRYATSLPVGGGWTAISGSGATTTSHTVPSLANGTRYYFQIRATNAVGDSAASDPGTVQLAAAPATAVAITDAALRSALEASVGKEAGETITQLDMAQLAGASLTAARSGVSSLAGLEYAVNVIGLNFDNNAISDLAPLASLTELTWLLLNGNQISNVTPLAGLTSLTVLRLGENEIADVTPLGGLTALTQLLLYRNQISDVAALGTLTGLTLLSLGGNQISDVSPLGTLTSLTTLRLWGNRISDVTPLGGLTALTELNLGNALGGNQISDVTPLATLTSLQVLLLNNNQISDVTPLGTLTSLLRLWVQYNRITDVTLGGLPWLGVLALDHNQISDVALGSLPALSGLSLSGNRISDLAQLTGLSGLNSLTGLGLDHNQISDVAPLAALAGLESLTLSHNRISDIASLGDLTSLSLLVLSENPISDIAPLGSLTSLSLLHLYNCRIADVAPLGGLTALSSLDLRRNEIADVASLAANLGIGTGDYVGLSGNPLSRASVYVHIPAMRQRGATVDFNALPSEPNAVPEAVRPLDDVTLAVAGVLTTNLVGAFRDPDGDPLTLSASSSQPAVAATRLDGNTLTVMALAEGHARITVRATDPFDETAILSFLVTVGNPVSIGGPDDTAGVADASVPEGGVAELAVAMAVPREEDVSFTYSLGPDSDPATADADAADHGGEGGTVTIAAGETEATIRIPIADDDDIEPAREAFAVALQPMDGAGLAVSSAVVHIEEGVCDRTWQVADALRGGRACAAVTPAELAHRRFVRLSDAGLAELKPLDFLGLTGMTVLFLDGNGLSALPDGLLAGSPGLRVLRLRGNRFETLPTLGRAPALIELDLAGNLLTELPASPFENLPALGYLYLGGNGIETLPADLLAEAAGLRFLELQDNALEALPEGLFAGVSKLFSLQLQDNPGAPFSLPVELAVVEADAEGEGAGEDGREDEEESGRATIHLRMPHAAPFAISAELSTPGATLSAQMATIAAGETLGEAVSVVRNVAGDEADAAVTIEIASVPNLPATACGDDYDEYRCFRGFELAPGSPLTLFEPPAAADVPRMR